MSPRLRRYALLAALMLGPPAAFAGDVYLTGNLHAVEPGVVYRSGQLSPSQLDRLVREKGIRSILNLRGNHPREAWWRDETRVAASNGVIYRSIPISARRIPDAATMRELARALKEAPKPLLVHCMGGSDRSGLASAIYQLAVLDRPVEEAARQLSIAYGHFPWLGSQTYAMDEAFAEFAADWTDALSRPDAKQMEAEARR